MLDLTSIENTIRTWIADIVTSEVIFAHPNAPRPKVPYVVVNIVNSNQIGQSEHIDTLQIDDSIDVEHSTMDELLISINTYYANAQQTAIKIKDSLNRITVIEDLWSGGLGFVRAGIITEVPEEINKRFEERAQFDCFFYVRTTDTENIETIKKIEITNEIDGSQTTIQ